MTVTNLYRETSQENREAHPVVQHLQREVANAFVLYANFLFDDLAGRVLGTIDQMAERIRMIGQDVQAVQLKQFQETSTVSSARATQSISEMLEEAQTNLLLVIKNMREAARVADHAEDPGTVDLFSKIVQVHERDEWFVREVLKKRDGLIT